MDKQKELTGTVVSDKMQKTRVVKVTTVFKHPKYGKIMKRANKFKAHDEKNISKSGDTVRIMETRPLSKEKHFRIVEVVKKAAVLHELKEEVK